MEAALEAGHLGAVKFLEKPVDPRILIETVQAAAVKATSDPFARAGEELEQVQVDEADAADVCLGILLRAMADQSLTLRQFDRLAAEMRRFTSTRAVNSVRRTIGVLDHVAELPRADDPTLSRVFDVMAVSKSITASELAAECDMSTRAFCTLLTTTTSRSVRYWARSARVKRALRKLPITSDDVTRCAHGAGYPAAAPFDRDCRSTLGMSPSRLREIMVVIDGQASPVRLRRTPPASSVNL